MLKGNRYLGFNFLVSITMAAELRIIAKNDDERMTVILPVPHGHAWPAGNIAYFCSTGQSGVTSFDGTYFPTFGVYVDDATTPIPDKEESITLVKNYFVKTSSISFLSPKSDMIQEWIFTILSQYYSIRGMSELFTMTLARVRDIHDLTRLRQMDDMYKESYLIYKCLSSYFTDIWQVRLSICLSDTFGTGVWLGPLKDFAEYVKSLSEPCAIEDARVTSDDVYSFLTGNHAQCDFRRLGELPVKWISSRSTHMHDTLFKNAQLIEMSLMAAERALKGGTRKSKKRKKTRNRFKPISS
jgi:hypothetical protein